MKKFFALVCALLLALSLTACGKPTPDEAGEANLRAVVEAAYTLPLARAAAFFEESPDIAIPGILPADLLEEVKGDFAPYFSDEEALKNFFSRYAYIAPGPALCAGTSWTVTVKEVTVTRPYDDERYEFAATLTYASTDESKTGGEITLRGEARRDDAGLLEYWAVSELDRPLLYDLQGLLTDAQPAA